MPEPLLVEVAIAPTSRADHAGLLAALDRLATDDPGFGVSHDPDSGQIILKGTGEASLDRAIGTLRRTSGIAVAVGASQVAYRETMRRRVEKDYTYKELSGETGQFARVKIIFAPDEAGGFASMVVGGAVPEAYVGGVETGVAAALRAGILAGFPVVGVKATLIDGAYHDADSSAATFEIAARAACREALREGGPVLLEPIMRVEVTTPEAYAGFVTGDIVARRGRVRRRDPRADVVVIEAHAPLANLFGYEAQLRAGTHGHAGSTTRFSHFAPLPDPGNDGPAAPAIALRG